MAYVTLDFGSSNSGALLNAAFGKEYNLSDLIYVHRQDGDAGFTKQPTVFWIKRSLLERSDVSDSDINIYSCVFYEKERYLENANFIWCHNQIKAAISKIKDNPEWICIQHPKMELYKLGNHSPANTQIRASDGSLFPLHKILRIFFLVIRKECLFKASEVGIVLDDNDISWAITVPGLAIWNQDAVSVIKDVAIPIFGDDLTLWSEPECALIGLNLSSSGTADVNFVNGRYSIVLDLGGGTADMCVMKETLNQDGTTTFDEIKSTTEDKDPTTSVRSGGNEIDYRFKSFLCESLANGVEIDLPIELYNNFKKDNPKGAMEFDERWHELQFSEYIEGETICFNPGRAYKDWLKKNHPAVLKNLDEYGDASFNGDELRKDVFEPIYLKILRSIEENLSVLKSKEIILDTVYFAGGLSLDKKLRKLIKSKTLEYFDPVKFIEPTDGSAVGAIQRGGNHIAVNKETLIRRMARKAFYTQLVLDFNWNETETDLRNSFIDRFSVDYYERFGMLFSDTEIKEKLEEQWSNLEIYPFIRSAPYLTPLCLRFAPVTKNQSFEISPHYPGKQTGVTLKVFSSDKNFIFFKNEDINEEGKLDYDFGFNWEKAKLVFDPNSNAVEGKALFYLTDNDGKKLKEFVIENVSKRGF